MDAKLMVATTPTTNNIVVLLKLKRSMSLKATLPRCVGSRCHSVPSSSRSHANDKSSDIANKH
ncbi:unnamed protein product, partial [Ilex paraguariensis]